MNLRVVQGLSPFTNPSSPLPSPSLGPSETFPPLQIPNLSRGCPSPYRICEFVHVCPCEHVSTSSTSLPSFVSHRVRGGDGDEDVLSVSTQGGDVEEGS